MAQSKKKSRKLRKKVNNTVNTTVETFPPILIEVKRFDMSTLPSEIMTIIFSHYNPLHVYKRYYKQDNKWFKSKILIGKLASCWNVNYTGDSFIGLIFEYDLTYGTKIISALYPDQRALTWLFRNNYDFSKRILDETPERILKDCHIQRRSVLQDYAYMSGDNNVDEDQLSEYVRTKSDLSTYFRIGKGEDSINWQNMYNYEIVKHYIRFGYQDQLQEFILLQYYIINDNLIEIMIQAAIYSNQISLLKIFLYLKPQNKSDLEMLRSSYNIDKENFDLFSRCRYPSSERMCAQEFCVLDTGSFRPYKPEDIFNHIPKSNINVFFKYILALSDEMVNSFETFIDDWGSNSNIKGLGISLRDCDTERINMNRFVSLYNRWRCYQIKDHKHLLSILCKKDRADLLLHAIRDIKPDNLFMEELLVESVVNSRFVSASIIWINMPKLGQDNGINKIINAIDETKTFEIVHHKSRLGSNFDSHDTKNMKESMSGIHNWIICRIGEDNARKLGITANLFPNLVSI